MMAVMHTEILEPIKRQKVAEQVRDRLCSMVQVGTWQSGQRLPSEKELCELLRVGRSSLREAVKSLEFMGLVEIRPGEGTFVTKDTSSAVDAAVARAVTLSQQDALDLIEARELIEAHMAALAALRIDADGLTELKGHWDRMRQNLSRPKPFVEADLSFHVCLAQAAQSRVLLRIYLTIRELLEQLIGQALGAPGTSQAAVDDHARIIQAIERRDAAAAGEAMRTHLDDIRDRLMSLLTPQ